MFHRDIHPSRVQPVFITLGLLIVLIFPIAAYGASSLDEFVLPTAKSGPADIVTGPDGNLWFTEAGANNIGRITPNGKITEFAVPTPNSGPNFLAVGPDDNLWFTEFKANKVGRITPKGIITEFAVPTTSAALFGIAKGWDGNLWFTEAVAGKIGQITTKGVITEFMVPTVAGVPTDIRIGPDHNLWFTELAAGKIGRITTKGTISEFPISTPDSRPNGIAAGPDGNLWFTEYSGNKIGRMTTKGTISEFPILTRNSQPSFITAGPDGNLWFTEAFANKIGRITVKGTISEFPIPTPNSQPSSITAGPDGNLWFTEFDGNKIGRISPTAKSAELAPTATATSDQENSTSQSPCVDVQPAAKNVQPNGQKQWTAPARVIDVSHIYCAIFTTNNGRMVVELFPKIAPKNVNNFVFLAQNGFYDNITWHRVIADFVAQSGDPTGTGSGGPGYSNIPLEVNGDLKYDRAGRLGVARTSDPNSAGSQFFITLAPLPNLNGGYTIIGQVVEGLSVLHQIKIHSTDTNPNLPKGDPLLSVRIVDLGSSPAVPTAPATPGS